jgi:hypothetical protein
MMHMLDSLLGEKVAAIWRLLRLSIEVRRKRWRVGVMPTGTGGRARELRRARIRCMRRDLHQLLNQHPDARRLMRHITRVEYTLSNEGLRAMEALPQRVLGSALIELERLVWDWSPSGLAELRSRLAVLMRASPSLSAEDATQEEVDEPLWMQLPHVIQYPYSGSVSDIDHAAFADMAQSWTRHGSQPRTRGGL